MMIWRSGLEYLNLLQSDDEMPSPTILDIGFIFAFMFLVLMLLSEYFAYSKRRSSMFIDIDKSRKLAIIFGIIFIICATIYISLQMV